MCWCGLSDEVEMICILSCRCYNHPIVSPFFKIENCLTFLVPTYSGYPGKEASKRMLFFMAALWNRTGHYIFALWFLPSSIFFFSPNLSGCRMDVYHTSTHDVVLLRI